MITKRWSCDELRDLIVPRHEWRPYPPASDQQGWNAVPEPVRDGLIAAGEEAIQAPWPDLPATLFLEFVRTGNRKVYENSHFPRRQQLAALVLAECAEGQGRFTDAVVNALWSICEESFWGISAHLSAQKAGAGLPDTEEPVVDLFAAETAAQVSWSAYLLGGTLEEVSPLLLERLHREVSRRMLQPCLTRDDFWWMGTGARRSLNNWTPWICSNWLTAALLMERDEDSRAASICKAVTCLDRFLEQCPEDGGCDEGPGYWNRAGASVFDCLELLHRATDGAVDLFHEPLIRNLGSYITKVHIDQDWFVNVADANARQRIATGVVLRYGVAVEDPNLVQLGWYCRQRGGGALPGQRLSLQRALPEVFDLPPKPDSADIYAPHVADAWLPSLHLLTARSQSGTADGFFVAAKGGHNAESHNHNDVGNVIVFLDGKPVLVDAGVEHYTAKTFSGERYTIWTMQSAYHNLPTFDDIQQMPGRDAAARDVSTRIDDDVAEITMDLAGAYPAHAGLTRCRRTLALHRGKDVEVVDEMALTQPRSVTLSLMTPCQVQREDDGSLTLWEDREREGSPLATLTVDADEPAIGWEHIATDDGRLKPSWPNGLNRITVTLPETTQATVRLRIE